VFDGGVELIEVAGIHRIIDDMRPWSMTPA
jgi:hypothetical protein